MRKYYTPFDIAKALVSIVPDKKYKSSIDICCGSWNLLRAAHERWPNMHLTGVDIDSSLKENININGDFINKDGREYAMECLGKEITYDLVLANPPFNNLSDKKDYNQKLLNGIFSDIRTYRLEVMMFIANLKILKKNGYLLIIIPSSIINGTNNLKLRTLLSSNYLINYIIKLPNKAFGPELSCYAILLQNKKGVQDTIYFEINKEEGSYNNINHEVLYSNQMLKGEWLPNNQILNNNEISEDKITCYRGNISSNMFTLSGVKVLHTSKNTESWKPSVRFISKDLIPKTSIKYAFNNDIIISRIGKSAGSCCIYKGPKIPISDCLVALRMDDQEKLIRVIDSIGSFFPFIKGVAAKYITSSDLVNHIRYIINNNISLENKPVYNG